MCLFENLEIENLKMSQRYCQMPNGQCLMPN